MHTLAASASAQAFCTCIEPVPATQDHRGARRASLLRFDANGEPGDLFLNGGTVL
jgi:hypothetical protein